jgi:hypothetical protein
MLTHLIAILILVGAGGMLAPAWVSWRQANVRRAQVRARQRRFDRELTSGFNWDSICHS